MNLAFQFVALFTTALFAGAALYINPVEHPARMECGTALAATGFGPSYRRATRLQASLAIVACLSALTSWWMDRELAWLVGAILIGSIVPFTLIVILPTNNKLLDPALDRGSETARKLLVRWARLHWVRTLLSLVALATLLLGSMGSDHDGIRRAREAALRQDLSVLRSQISQYTLDKKKAPQSLEDLKTAGYIREIPKDPMTNRANWVVALKNAHSAVDQTEPGISDVHSASTATGSDGTAYNTW
jgi:competence protein ComGC